MVDYKAWGTVDPIAVEDAAYLWAGIDPSTYKFALTAEMRGAFTARLKMLTVRIQSKTLSANTDSNAAAFIGVHDKSLVARADLRIVAESLGERPAFLFFNEPSDGPASLVEKQVSDHKYALPIERVRAIETLSHRPGSPRRLSKAPPPPPRVGGGGAVWEFPPKEPQKATINQSLGAAPSTISSVAHKPVIAQPSPLVPAASHRRPAGRKGSQREKVRQWIAEKYPDGLPANITTDAIVAELKEDGIAVSPRTFSRAMGRK